MSAERHTRALKQASGAKRRKQRAAPQDRLVDKLGERAWVAVNLCLLVHTTHRLIKDRYKEWCAGQRYGNQVHIEVTNLPAYISGLMAKGVEGEPTLAQMYAGKSPDALWHAQLCSQRQSQKIPVSNSTAGVPSSSGATLRPHARAEEQSDKVIAGTLSEPREQRARTGRVPKF